MSLRISLRWNLKVFSGIFWACFLPGLMCDSQFLICIPAFECLNFPKSFTQVLLSLTHGVLNVSTHNLISTYMCIYNLSAAFTSSGHHTSPPKIQVKAKWRPVLQAAPRQVRTLPVNNLVCFVQIKEVNWELCNYFFLTKIISCWEGLKNIE